MPRLSPSAALRAQLRQRIRDRILELHIENAAMAAEQLGLSRAQMSRLNDDEDIFSLDRLVDAAARLGLTLRMTATRPYMPR